MVSILYTFDTFRCIWRGQTLYSQGDPVIAGSENHEESKYRSGRKGDAHERNYDSQIDRSPQYH